MLVQGVCKRWQGDRVMADDLDARVERWGHPLPIAAEAQAAARSPSATAASSRSAKYPRNGVETGTRIADAPDATGRNPSFVRIGRAARRRRRLRGDDGELDWRELR